MKTTLLIVAAFAVVTIACQRDAVGRASTTTIADSVVMPGDTKPTLPDSVQIDTNSESRRNRTTTVQKSDSTDDKNYEFCTLLSATSQRWVAGVESGGRGIDYSFRVRITTQQEISFDSAWIDNRAHGVAVSKGTARVSNQPVTISNGDSLVLRVSVLEESATLARESRSPITYSGAALISFHVNGKRYYLVINDIKSQKANYRP
jgi:hypothetical protein